MKWEGCGNVRAIFQDIFTQGLYKTGNIPSQPASLRAERRTRDIENTK
jgi:hypothetical protein